MSGTGSYFWYIQCFTFIIYIFASLLGHQSMVGSLTEKEFEYIIIGLPLIVLIPAIIFPALGIRPPIGFFERRYSAAYGFTNVIGLLLICFIPIYLSPYTYALLDWLKIIIFGTPYLLWSLVGMYKLRESLSKKPLGKA